VPKLRWSSQAKEQYDSLRSVAEKAQSGRAKSGKTKKSKQEGLFNQVHKALCLLSANPRHKSLQTHKYSSVKDRSGKDRGVFEAYARNRTPGAYRIFWCYGPGRDEITVVAITPHP